MYEDYYYSAKKVSKNPKWKSITVTPKLIEFDHNFDYKKVDKMLFANVLTSISMLNRNANKKTNFNKGINDNRRDSKTSLTRFDSYNDFSYQNITTTTSQLLANSGVSEQINTTSTNFTFTNNNHSNQTNPEEFLEETQIIDDDGDFYDEMSEEQAIAINEHMYNLEEFYQINPQQQRHRISIDLTGNIVDDDNSSVSDDDEATLTQNDNLSSKGHVNSLSDSFSRSLNLNKDQSNSATLTTTTSSATTTSTSASVSNPSVPLNRFNSPSLNFNHHQKNLSRHDSAATSILQTSNSEASANQTTSRVRSRFLRSKTVSENLIQLPQSNLDGSLLSDELNDLTSKSNHKRYVSNGLMHKNSLDAAVWNRAQANGMKRVKTAIGMRNHTPVMTTPEFSSITNSVFKQSLSQRYQQNLLAKSSFILQSSANNGNSTNNNNNSNNNTNQAQRELSIIDLQLPINRSFTVAGANLSQQQLLAISKRNNISKLNDYYSITNSTDYVQSDGTTATTTLSNTTNSNHVNNTISNNSTNSATLASKIIMTTLTKTHHSTNEHRIARAVSASNADYNEILRNNNNSSENQHHHHNHHATNNNHTKKTAAATEFQITFPFRNHKNYYKYLQQQQQEQQFKKEQNQQLQQKKRQMNSAKTPRRPINSINNNIIRHDLAMTDEYLNSISSEALLIRRLKF